MLFQSFGDSLKIMQMIKGVISAKSKKKIVYFNLHSVMRSVPQNKAMAPLPTPHTYSQ